MFFLHFLVAFLLGTCGLPCISSQRRVCPKVMNIPDVCPSQTGDECELDTECVVGKKCCNNGCRLMCVSPVKLTGCPIPLDLAILVDSSGSITEESWRKMIRFVQEVATEFDISTNGTHIGVIVYSNDANVFMRFNSLKGAHLNPVEVSKRMRELPHHRNRTFIDKALLLADKELFSEDGGMRPGVKKVALVITDGLQTTTRGPYTPLDQASQTLKDKGVTIFSLGIGPNIAIIELLQMASDEQHVYNAESFNQLQDVVKTVTQGQCKGCHSSVDVIFGLPVSIELNSADFETIKDFTRSAIGLFDNDFRKAHIGLVLYNSIAYQVLKLDSIDSQAQIQLFVDREVQQTGRGFNLAAALTTAANNAFTIFGGTRPSAPKTMILLTAGSASSSQDFLQAATRLKDVGVRLIIVGIGEDVDAELMRLAGSQPSLRFYYEAQEYVDLHTQIDQIVYSACKGNHAKCPYLESSSHLECPPKPAHHCTVDEDCGQTQQSCCKTGCERNCIDNIKGCFITMDVGVIIDISESITTANLKDTKTFVKSLVSGFANAENSVRVGIMTFDRVSRVIARFDESLSENNIRAVVDGISIGNGPPVRMESLVTSVKEQLFSLEGGVRQGHPRKVIFLTSGASSWKTKSLEKSLAGLDGLGLTRLAVGIASNVQRELLQSLASANNLAFQVTKTSQLSSFVPDIQGKLCEAKAGLCPPVRETGGNRTCPSQPPRHLIPCGRGISPAGEVNITRGDDDVCPGEEKCCLSYDGCHLVCRPVPNGEDYMKYAIEVTNECKKNIDLALLLEHSNASDSLNFEKVKQFARQLVGLFEVSFDQTRVAIVIYGAKETVAVHLNSYKGLNLDKETIQNRIDELTFEPGRVDVASALELVSQEVFTKEKGMRKYGIPKALVLICSGKTEDIHRAISASKSLKERFVDMFAVSIGRGANIEGLKAIASEEPADNIFLASSYNALEPNLRVLTERICEGGQEDVVLVLGKMLILTNKYAHQIG